MLVNKLYCKIIYYMLYKMNRENYFCKICTKFIKKKSTKSVI